MSRAKQILAYFREVAPTMTQRQIVVAAAQKFDCTEAIAAAYISQFKKKHNIQPLDKKAAVAAPVKKFPEVIVTPVKSAMIDQQSVGRVVRPTKPAPVINEIDINAVPLFLRKSWEKHM